MVKEETTGDSKPLLTAVMPVYNGERHLRETLDHIVNQEQFHVLFLYLDDMI